MHWTCSRFRIDVSAPRLMGIVNLTPDSFSDGGRDTRASLRHAEQLLREGADILDLGAESSRPGAPRIAAETEWQRLQPVLTEALRLGVPVSVDSCKTEVMRRALDLGVDIVNDIQALQAPGALALLNAHPQAGVLLMHMRGEPAQMQQLTDYAELAIEVRDFLHARAGLLSGPRERVLLDPGFGFAKTAAQNLALQRAWAAEPPAWPWLAGWSRKSTLGWITGAPVDRRLAASVAAALAAVQAGACVLRVHDVAATREALQVWQAMAENPRR